MTDHSGHNDKKNISFFDQFASEEKEEIRDIWEKSGRITVDTPAITEDEIENALSEVHKSIDQKQKSSSKSRWKWLAAAAVALVIAGSGWFLYPQTVRAPRGKITTVELPDGSNVELNSGAEIRYNRLFSVTNRDIQLDGEAFFSVKKGDHRFIVSTHNTKVEVTGTKFNVRSWSDEPAGRTEVTVSEGAVHFYPDKKPGRTVIIHPGQLSAFSTGMQNPTKPKTVPVNRFLGWRQQKLIFNDRSLPVIFHELERRYDTTIRLEARLATHETLTAYYAEPKSIESVLKDICRVKGLRFSKTANGYRVYE
ncbi:MAG: FecR domain-containing protein [Balneolaceae bacterium]|jgi:ferric-dicitrate binding protein FerR (iron transport regulator)